VLAKAGLVRLGFEGRITSDLHPPTMFHAVGQAALAVEIRANDTRMKKITDSLNHWQTAWSCRAERACLRVLEGGCSVPVGVQTTLVSSEEGNRLKLTGTITSLDGQVHVEETVTEQVGSVNDAEAAGEKLAHLLVESGGRAILDEVTKDRASRKLK
jgi:hydroxymethylbilane synthase